MRAHEIDQLQLSDVFVLPSSLVVRDDSQFNDEWMFHPAEDSSLVVDMLDLLQSHDLRFGEHFEGEVRHRLRRCWRRFWTSEEIGLSLWMRIRG